MMILRITWKEKNIWTLSTKKWKQLSSLQPPCFKSFTPSFDFQSYQEEQVLRVWSLNLLEVTHNIWRFVMRVWYCNDTSTVNVSVSMTWTCIVTPGLWIECQMEIGFICRCESLSRWEEHSFPLTLGLSVVSTKDLRISINKKLKVKN